jgi:hypothetical protein
MVEQLIQKQLVGPSSGRRFTVTFWAEETYERDFESATFAVTRNVTKTTKLDTPVKELTCVLTFWQKSFLRDAASTVAKGCRDGQEIHRDNCFAVVLENG